MAGLKALGDESSLLVAAWHLGIGFNVHDLRATSASVQDLTHVGPTDGKQVHVVYSGRSCGHYDLLSKDGDAVDACLFTTEDSEKVLELVAVLRDQLVEVEAAAAKVGPSPIEPVIPLRTTSHESAAI